MLNGEGYIVFKDKVYKDMTDALRAKDTKRLAALRLFWAAIRQREIDERIVLDDTQVLSVLEKMLKQRRDSIEQYLAGNRPDLVAKEQEEIDVLAIYLPQQLTEAEVVELIKQAIQDSGANSVKDMGKVMAIVKTKTQGKADMGKVSGMIKEILNFKL